MFINIRVLRQRSMDWKIIFNVNIQIVEKKAVSNYYYYFKKDVDCLLKNMPDPGR